MFPSTPRACRRQNFSNPSCFRGEMSVSSKSRHLGGGLDTNFYQVYESPKNLHSGWSWFSVWTFLVACRNDQYPHHHLVRCLSRNMTCPISAVQSQDITIGGTKTGFRSPNCRIFSFLFQHVIRIAFVYSFKGGQVLFFVFFTYFFAKISAGFSGNDYRLDYTPAFENKKKSWPPLNRLVVP